MLLLVKSLRYSNKDRSGALLRVPDRYQYPRDG